MNSNTNKENSLALKGEGWGEGAGVRVYIIAGEASGDLHASHLMHALREQQADIEFRGIGGDLMQAEGLQLRHHYRDLAYMGIFPVLFHLPTILRGMRETQQDILSWQSDMLILVDYPGFNLKVAKFVKEHTDIPIYYYIAPKLWAWKEWRIKNLRRDISRIYSILPFEVGFFEGKHHLEIDYVGNPTVDEVAAYKQAHPADPQAFRERNGLDGRPVIALLAGSRKQEIADNLRRMAEAAKPFATDYQLVLAAAPAIPDEFYRLHAQGLNISILRDQTYPLLQHATAALVTSGTATLETALFGVPQVVCYYMKAGRLALLGKRVILKIPYISLVNLIADREVVPELVASQMTVSNVRCHLQSILPLSSSPSSSFPCSVPDGSAVGSPAREAQLLGYRQVAARLGQPGAPQRAAALMLSRQKGMQEAHHQASV